jgi:hypothetical protein
MRIVAGEVNPALTRLDHVPLNVSDFGVSGDKATDDTVNFQKAITYAANSGRALFLPPDCIIRLTSTITSTKPVALIGFGTSPFDSTPIGQDPTRGSWLYFDHTGKGLVFDGSGTTSISGVSLSNFGTFRTQPAPASSWAPTDHDFDIVLLNADSTLDSLMFLNATRGLKVDNSRAGRLTARNIAGQFMKVGIQLDHQYDVCRVEGFRNWAFWADDANVWDYTTQNCDAIYLLRVDNPQFSNIFSVRHRAGIRVGESGSGGTFLPGGTLSLGQFSNIGFDFGQYGIWLDPSIVSGAWLDMTNFYANCQSLASSAPVMVQGYNSRLTIINSRLTLAEENAVRIVGTGVETGNTVTLSGNLYIYGWDSLGSGFPAIYVAASNTCVIGAYPDISGKYGRTRHD